MNYLWKASSSGHLAILSHMRESRESPSFSRYYEILIVTGGTYKMKSSYKPDDTLFLRRSGTH